MCIRDSSKSKQFLIDLDGLDISKYKKVNYPNFEILVLDAYINLFKGDGINYCPAFWDNCSEDSLKSFFQASEDFSRSWSGEENVMKFLTDHFVNHHCTMYLDTSIDQKTFISVLNILINVLSKLFINNFFNLCVTSIKDLSICMIFIIYGLVEW